MGNSWTHGVDIDIKERVRRDPDQFTTNFQYICSDKRLILYQMGPNILDIEKDDFLSLPSIFSNHIIRTIEIGSYFFWPEDIVELVSHFANGLTQLSMSDAILLIDHTTRYAHHQWKEIFQIAERLCLECSFSQCGFRDGDSNVASYKSFNSVSEWREELVAFNDAVPDVGSIGELDEEGYVVGTNGTWYKWPE